MDASALEHPPGDRWRHFRCNNRPHRDEMWLEPAGELDMESANVLGALVDEYLDAGFPRLVLDLRAVTFMDSSGLHVLLEAQREARARGVELTLSPGPPNVQRIFDVTGTADLFAAPARR
jgi:anti-sigma B factor antagonist